MFIDKFARKLGSTSNVLKFAETGRVSAASFTGSPRKATVTLQATQADDQYSVAIVGADGRIWTVESKTASSFVISTNADEPLTGPVTWMVGGDI